MNLNNINRDELISHTAEILSTQDDKIFTLLAERRILVTLLGLSLIFHFL